MEQIFALLGTALIVGSWIPQAIRLHKIKDSRSMSLITQIILLIAAISWVVYAYIVSDLKLALANILIGLMGAYIIFLIIRFRPKKNTSLEKENERDQPK